MSSSDIFDVLNIKPKGNNGVHDTASPVSTAVTPTTTNQAVKQKPITGIQRELFSLLGENESPIVLQPQVNNRFKEKFAGKPSPWSQVEFIANEKYPVKFRHWLKGSKELLGNELQLSTYSKFDQQLTLPTFTRDEYIKFMGEDIDKDWSFDEIAYLFSLCKRYDLRWFVINDRYHFEANNETSNEEKLTKEESEDNKDNEEIKEEIAKDRDDKIETGKNGQQEQQQQGNDNNKEDETNIEQNKENMEEEKEKDDNIEITKNKPEVRIIERSIEEIKNKFYEVSKKYMLFKDPKDPNIDSLNYDMSKELERKLYLERLLSRTAAEIAEEEALIIESRKFEMAAKKTLNERESLLRLLDSPNSDQNVSQYLTSQGISQLYNNLLNDKSRKRKNDSNIPENPWMKQQQQFAQQKQQLQQLHEKRHTEVINNVENNNGNNVENNKNHGTINNKILANGITNSTGMVKNENGTSGNNNDNSNDDNNDNNGTTDDITNPRKTKKQRQELQISLKKKQEAEYAENLVKIFNDSEKKQLGVICHGEKLQPGVYLRSTKILSFKPALQNKILTVLQELNLPLRPSMPTYDVLKKQEELLRHIVTLLELKKKLDRINAEKDITK